MAATIRDVARHAGVSQSTVSRVINGSGYVSAATRRRVLDAAELLGFKPNFLARSLVHKATRTLALVLPDITNPFFPAVARAVEDAAARRGYTVILTNTDDRLEREVEVIAHLREKWVDGLLLVPCGEDDRHLAALAAAEVPVVLLDRAPDGLDVDTVQVDNARGGYLATRHLAELGHRRIGHISGPPRLRTSRERMAGYRQALAGAGLPQPDCWTAPGDFHLEGGRAAMARLLEQNPRPTAVFVANDMMAVGALQACRSAGLAVPDDVAVVGFDDILVASLTHPQLTTVRQPAYEMGVRAAELLLGRVDGSAGGAGRRVEFTPTLVIRESCGSRRPPGPAAHFGRQSP